MKTNRYSIVKRVCGSFFSNEKRKTRKKTLCGCYIVAVKNEGAGLLKQQPITATLLRRLDAMLTTT